VIGASSVPEILLCRFQAHQQFINQGQLQDSTSNQLTPDAVAKVKEDLGTFLVSALTKDQTSDNYRELLEITHICCHHSTMWYMICAPGAWHQTRWMSKTIYTFKV
jgi:hypothetical protein